MSLEEDKVVTFALTPQDYHYEIKLARFLYKIDELDEPTVESLAVWCHNFAIGAISRKLGQMYVVNASKSKEEGNNDNNGLPDFDRIIPDPIYNKPPIPARAEVPKVSKELDTEIDDVVQNAVSSFEKELEDWAK